MNELALAVTDTDMSGGYYGRAFRYVIHLPSEWMILVDRETHHDDLERIYRHLVQGLNYQPTEALEQLRLLLPYSLKHIDQLEDELVVKALEGRL